MKSIIINSLDSSWDSFIMHLDTINLGHTSLETLTSMLIAEDNLKREHQSIRKELRPSKRVDFQEETHHSPECFLCGSRNHYKKDCPKDIRGWDEQERRPRFQERHPHDSGYRCRDSPNPKNRRGHRDNSREGRAGSLYGLRDHNTIQMREANTWLIDSGATNHTTCNRNLLTSVSKENFTIKVANQHQALNWQR